jgi:hypothetical protein
LPPKFSTAKSARKHHVFKGFAGTGFEPVTFGYESMSRAWFRRLRKSERLNFSSGTEVQITVAERRRLIV